MLTRHYASEQRRQRALARAEERAAADGFSKEVVAALLNAATGALTELARTGRLDWEPTEEELVKSGGRAPRVEKAETRLELEEARPVHAYNKAFVLVSAMVQAAVERKMQELRLDFYTTKRFYHNWVNRLVLIAAEHGTDSAEWRAEVDKTAPRMHDEAFAREAAALAAATFNRWKPRLRP